MPADVHGAALLADARRREYEAYSPVFWRPATDAFERHEPWLAQCIAADDQTSFAADAEDGIAGIAIAAHSASPPPFRFDEEPTWLIDDFYVQDSAKVANRATATFLDWASASNAVVAIVPARSSDVQLEAALAESGYEVASDWFVRELSL